MRQIIRKTRDIKTRGLQSKMDTGRWHIQQKDELIVQEIIISNHGFCAKREKYTKEIREELDPRDKQYTFPFQTTFNITQYLTQRGITFQYNPANQQENTKDIVEKKSEEYLKLQRTVFNYISEVSQNVFSIAFRLLSKGQLTDGQVKAFAVKIILANIQSVLNNINSEMHKHALKPQWAKQFDDLMERLTKAIDEELSYVFSQLAGHYSQTPAAGATASMRQVIVDMNRTQDEQNNLIFSSGIKIDKYVKVSQDGRTILNKPQDYTGFVMEVINQSIQITKTVIDQDLTLFQKFQEFNQRLFVFANTDKKSQKLSLDDKKRLQSLTISQILGIFHNLVQAKKSKKQLQTQQQRQRQKQNQASLQFQSRIIEQYKKNHKILLAQKIPNHVKQFSHAEIKESNFKVNHSSVLRIMTKWVESLQDIFQKADQKVGQRQYLFKDIHHNFLTYQIDKGNLDEIKRRMVPKLKEEYESVKVSLNKLKEENALFQSYILSEQDQQSSYLKRFSKVREASAQINAIAIQYTKKYLCILIHHLIKAGHIYINSSFFITVDLAAFKVGDLLRSKLQCGERNFINVMKILSQLDNSKQMEGKFKLVRVKNKLNMRDNNILINYLFMGRVQCELQLSVQKMDDRDKHYYEFCHFLYQLTRGKFGVITQCAIVACQHDSIINSSTDAYYRPKCYGLLQRKKRIHKIHEKIKDIYKCINCGQLKMGENTNLFQEEIQCNTCIVKQDGAQQKIKSKNDFLSKQKRIKKYAQISDGDYIVSVSNLKTNSILKLYKAWKPQEQIKLFLVEINDYSLREFQKPDFQYDKINYFNILNKKKKNEDLKELTYNLGRSIATQALQCIGIDSALLQKIQPFFVANRSYRMQKNLIKQVQSKSEFINARSNQQKWNILRRVVSAYSQGDFRQLRYKRYKKIDWTHIKNIDLRQNRIKIANQLLQLTHGCKILEIGSNNQMTQIKIDKLEKLQYFSVWGNKISSINFKNNPLLTDLHLGQNPLTEIRLNCHPNLQALYAIGDGLQHIDVSSCINLKNLQLDRNHLKEIDLSNCINLETISLSSNQLENLNFQGNFKLKRMNLSFNSKLQSVKLWSSQVITFYLQLYGVSSKCLLTVLYRKQDSQKHNEVLAQLNEAYNQFSIQSEEKN